MNKKMKGIILILAVLALSLLAACKKEKEPISTPEEVSFRAVITEISGTSMLVTPVEGSEELKSSDAFRIPIENMSPSPEPGVGDTVEIVYKGGILETYPASLEEIVSITVIEQAEMPEEASVEEEPQKHPAGEREQQSDVEVCHDKSEVTGPFGTISVDVPENWTWEVCPVDSGTLTYGQYGIILKPVDAISGQIELIYQQNFAVCGTGLEQKEMTLAGVKANCGFYDGRENWEFITFQGNKENVVAQAILCDAWTDDMWNEALQILDTVDLDNSRASGGIGQYTPECENDDISVIMDVRNVTPTGAVVHLNQYDNREQDELIYGMAFSLEKKVGDSWERLPVIVEGDWCFTEEGYPIPQGGDAEMETDWEWLYGTLEPGTYRICKSVSRAHKEYELYAQFILA